MAEISELGAFDRFILRGPGPFAIPVPLRPLRSSALEGGAALWLGPDEWLILTEEGAGAALAERLADGSAPMSLVDVSHRHVALGIRGAETATLLNGAVPLDLSLAAFPPGTCVRTLCGKAEIVLWRRTSEAWHMEVARSFAPYVRDLLGVIAEADAIALSAASP